ncbi:hypothetical protein ACFQ51_23370 [Streptomyces kaempferi]
MVLTDGQSLGPAARLSCQIMVGLFPCQGRHRFWIEDDLDHASDAPPDW